MSLQNFHFATRRASNMADSEEHDNPLEDLYVGSREIDRERIRDVLSGLIGIDSDSGKPLFLEGFDSLSSKEQFTALLLYRQAISELGDLDEDEAPGAGSTYFAELLGVDGSTIRHASSDLDFVTNDDDQGGYLIQSHNIRRAADWLEPDETDT